jgi:hypothetical protein
MRKKAKGEGGDGGIKQTRKRKTNGTLFHYSFSVLMAPPPKDTAKSQTSVPHHQEERNPLGPPPHAGPPLDSPRWTVLPRALGTPLNKPPTREGASSLACTTYNHPGIEAEALALVNAPRPKLDYRTQAPRVVWGAAVVEVVVVGGAVVEGTGLGGVVRGKRRHHRGCRRTTECCKTVRSRGLTTGCSCRGRLIIYVALRQREGPFSTPWRK